MKIENGFTIEQKPHGYVRLIDSFGTDQRIVEAARVSYGSPSKGEEADKKLLLYLWKHRHTSPFEQCNITFNIKMPIFIMRQFVRHRTFKLNEWSGRYSELADEFYIPEKWRKQDTKNKQGSVAEQDWDVPWSEVAEAATGLTTNQILSDNLEKFCAESYRLYQEMLSDNVAKEMARFVLPLNTYTEIYVNCDLHNLLHFLTLRTDSHAQKEIQDVANAMLQITEQIFPWTIEAWRNFKFQIIETQDKE